MQIYVVEAGVTVDDIAKRFSVPAEDIIYSNQLVSPYPLAIGQALLIPIKEEHEKSQLLLSLGYAYPFINPDVLKETLTYLTELAIFSYGFTTEGYLIPPELPDDWMITEAINAKTLPILTLTPLGPDGKFSNELITAVVNNQVAKQNLIDQLKNTLQTKGYKGVDVDFEYIKQEDRDAFTSFVKDLTVQMNALDYRVSVALAPKTSSEQVGLLYQGKDYGGLGAAANSVLLMTYEWGYTYGPPMAVAPIDKQRQVVEYAITEIPRGKIKLGIPNYGYDWPLPYEKGVTVAKTVGVVEAVQIAVKYGVNIEFDEVAKSPFFRYFDENGIQHEVWFEDVRSMQAKFDLIKEFTLQGCGYWQVMKLFRANWILLDDNFYINKAAAPSTPATPAAPATPAEPATPATPTAPATPPSPTTPNTPTT